METMIEAVMETTTTLVALTPDGLRCLMDQEDVNNPPGHLLLPLLTLEIQILVRGQHLEEPIEYHQPQRKQGYHLHPRQAIEIKTLTLSSMLQQDQVITTEQ